MFKGTVQNLGSEKNKHRFYIGWRVFLSTISVTVVCIAIHTVFAGIMIYNDPKINYQYEVALNNRINCLTPDKYDMADKCIEYKLWASRSFKMIVAYLTVLDTVEHIYGFIHAVSNLFGLVGFVYSIIGPGSYLADKLRILLDMATVYSYIFVPIYLLLLAFFCYTAISNGKNAKEHLYFIQQLEAKNKFMYDQHINTLQTRTFDLITNGHLNNNNKGHNGSKKDLNAYDHSNVYNNFVSHANYPNYANQVQYPPSVQNGILPPAYFSTSTTSLNKRNSHASSSLYYGEV
jgi:hypothetical protein